MKKVCRGYSLFMNCFNGISLFYLVLGILQTLAAVAMIRGESAAAAAA